MAIAKYRLIPVIAGISPVVSVTVIDLAGTDIVDVGKIGNETMIVTGLEMMVVVIEFGSRIDGIGIGIGIGTRSEIAVKTEIVIANVIEEGKANATVVVTVVLIVKESASVVGTDLNLPTPTIAPPNPKLAA
jgi:hypothetical protein